MTHFSRPPPDEGGLVHISEILGKAYVHSGPTYSSDRVDRPKDRLALHAVKHLRDTVILRHQREIATPWGPFELCFDLQWGDRQVGIEIAHDGFGQGEYAAGEEWKDGILLGLEAVDTIYHLRASDIERYPQDLLYLISLLDPELFSERGRGVLEQVASDEALASTDRLRSLGVSAVSYRRQSVRKHLVRRSQFISHLMFERRQLPDPGDDGFYADLRHLYKFAQDHGPGTLSEVQVAYWEQVNAA